MQKGMGFISSCEKKALGYCKELSIFVVPRLVACGDLEGDGSVASVRSFAA